MNPYIRETNYSNAMLSSIEARKAAESFKYNQEDRLLRAEQQGYSKGMDRENLMIADEERRYQREMAERAFAMEQEEIAYQREKEANLMNGQPGAAVSSSAQSSNRYGTTGGTPLPTRKIRAISGEIGLERDARLKAAKKKAENNTRGDVETGTQPQTERERLLNDKLRAETRKINVQTDKDFFNEKKPLTELDKIKIEKADFEYKSSKIKSANSFINNVTQDSYDSFNLWQKSEDIYPDGWIPSTEEVKEMSPVRFNQWKSSAKVKEYKQSDVLAREKFEEKKIADERKIELASIKADKAETKRLNKLSDGELSKLKPYQQQDYLAAEERLKTYSEQAGNKIMLSPAVEKNIRSKYGEYLTPKQVSKKLSEINKNNKKLDLYSEKNPVENDYVNALMQRDGKSELEVRRAISRKAIADRKKELDLIREKKAADKRFLSKRIFQGTAGGMTIRDAREMGRQNLMKQNSRSWR